MYLNGCSRKRCPMQVGCTDNCKLTKEQCPYFTQDIDYQKVLNLIKAEVAREIFEEIEEVFRQHTEGGYYLNGAWFPERLDLYTGDAIAELKKKYTEV